MKNDRALAPDLLKSMAIFGVVFIHCGTLAGMTQPVMYVSGLCRLCVPVFVIVWSFFQERSRLRMQDSRRMITVGLVRLGIPFVFWTIFYFFIAGDHSNVTLKTFITRNWLGYGWSGQYFFVIIIQLLVLFPLIRVLPITKLFVIVVFALYASIFSIINLVAWPYWFVALNYRPFVYWLPYVVLGIYLARNPQERLPPIAAVIGLSSVLIEAVLIWSSPTFDAEYTKPFILIGSGLLAASTLNYRALNSNKNLKLRLVCVLVGSSTMGIFVLNPLFRIGLVSMTERIHWQGFTDPLVSTLVSLLTAGGVIGCCLLMRLALMRAGLGRLVT